MTLEELQTALQKHKLDAYIVTRNNMFIGQDLLDEENQILNLTGFTGSAGLLIVTPHDATLLVDGRYEIQAAQEVDPQKVQILCGQGKLFYKWLSTHIGANKLKIAYNSWTNDINNILHYEEHASEATFIADDSKIFDNNLVLKPSNIFQHKIEFSGVENDEKIATITKFLNQHNLDAYLVTSADNASWLLNIRAACLPHSPIVRAYALVDKSGEVTLFGNHLNFDFDPESKFNILPISALEKSFSQYKNKIISLNYSSTPQQILNILDKHKVQNNNWLAPNIRQNQAIKNPIEISGIEKAHLQDGIALCKFLFWFSQNFEGQTELDIVNKLHNFRTCQENFFSESFGTIAGFGSNGAIVHYQPTTETNKVLVLGSLLLLDSGAHYYNGTTDVTRTLAVGKPNQEMIDNFTLVLKSHIALSSVYFPTQTSGQSLDKIARSVMWREGKDYKHGTGHGVGCFLNVHEGPQNMGLSGSVFPINENTILSIEPGYYKEGHYGIRIENLVRVIVANNPKLEKEFLQFKILTLAPIDKRLVNKYLMSSEEIFWLNNYHQEVFEKVSPFINEDEKDWLNDVCSPL